ncbi:hypothetical protein [Natrinema sp. 1APR25-10V2]|uniref:hypothetical protein n=1 Tax=Natrinema sp. 1APR25-10V2 TaxID=2951081 RepID=UPI0028748361|nr:hypothetical protein [Natrinema sp. 1APR25-10V2]MDS0473637.1 hypothetical protein [Natrinema sp. 1APR25-10V2]
MAISIKYYDLILLGVLASLLLGFGIGAVTTISTAITVPASALIGIALIYQTIFLRGPVSSTDDLSEEAHQIELPK